MIPDSSDALLEQAGWIRRLARSLVTDGADADDVAQDVSLAALRHDKEIESGLRPWLARVARNLASNRRRGSARRTARETAAALPESLPSASLLVERMELQRRLVGLVLGLREPYRSTIYLRFYEELPAAEIARRTGAPAATVRSHLKRGLEELRARLDDAHGGDRSAWSAVLLPFGAVTMKVSTKIAAAAAAVLLGASAAGGWWALSASTPIRERGISAPAVADAVATAPKKVEALGSTQPSERTALTSKPAEKAAATADAECRFEARAVDTARSPISGAVLTVSAGGDPHRSEPSRADGILRAAFAWDFEECGFAVRIARPGYASRFLEAMGRTGRTTYLGNVVLERGGRASGRVLDAKGNAVADARVFSPAPTGLEDLETERLLGPDSDPSAPETRTRADGTFVLDGIPAGGRRIWAGAEGAMHACTKLLEVRADDELAGLEIVLVPLPPASLIEGVVLDPEGAPVPRAEIATYFEYDGGSESSAIRADARGRFRLIAKKPVPYDLRARDPQSRWNEVAAPAVAPGSLDLALRFRATRRIEIAPKQRGGGAVELFTARSLPARGLDAIETKSRTRAEDPPLRLREPVDSYRIEVDALGYGLAVLGPFSSGAGPERPEILLDPVPGIRGRVLAAGAPAAGARVEAFPIARADESVRLNGFATRFLPTAASSCVTDAQGRFVLTPRTSGNFVVRAERDGSAPSELELSDVDSALARDPIEIVLGPGGAIEGRARGAAGVDPAGSIVAVSRYDGRPQTQRVGSDGHYRFEGLTPGRWNVAVVDREPRASGSTYSVTHRGQRPEFPTTCEVVEGATTTYDLELKRPQPCVLRGELRIDGKPADGFRIGIEPHGGVWGPDRDLPTAFVDAEGRFTLTVPAPGALRLLLTAPGLSVPQSRLSVRAELRPGENSWKLDLATGRVRVTNPAAPSDEAGIRILRTKSAGDVEALIPIVADEKGECLLTFVPAGRASVLRPTPGVAIDAWPSVLQIDVPAGGEVSVKLP